MNLPLIASEIVHRVHHSPDSVTNLEQVVANIIREEHSAQLKRVMNCLKEIENHCPCGARPESLNTHPHVGGCPVEHAIMIIERR